MQNDTRFTIMFVFTRKFSIFVIDADALVESDLLLVISKDVANDSLVKMV